MKIVTNTAVPGQLGWSLLCSDLKAGSFREDVETRLYTVNVYEASDGTGQVMVELVLATTGERLSITRFEEGD